MTRKTPLKRTTPIRRRKRKPQPTLVIGQSWSEVQGFGAIAADSKEARERKEWVHRQPCVFGRVTGDPCDGKPVQEMHCDRDKGMGFKSPRPTFSGCPRHHDMVSGAAKHPSVMPMEKLWRRAFEALASEQTEAAWQDVVAHEQRRVKL